MPDDADTPIADQDGYLPADTPPAWGTESDEQRRARLLKKARDLPKSPGVYLHKDHKGVVLYVGKASKLSDRVSSYFQKSVELGPRKQPMLDVVHDFDVLRCETEWEALLTEARLIKDIKPKYNAFLTDGKTFPYLAVTTQEDFPGVYVTRALNEERFRNATILGPFTSPGALHQAMQALQRVFKFRTCELDIREGDPKLPMFRPCLLHPIGRCSAPCAARIGKDDYRADIDRFLRFVRSRRSVMLRELNKEMEAASEARQYEKAALLRDEIKAIEKLDNRASRKDMWQPEAESFVLDPKKCVASLQRALEMESPIRCVEGIDIAHLQGGETVGSKVSFVDGRPFKEGYRRYRIRTAGNDDYASIREVVSRRYRDAGAGQELYPDVILIDGGLGQLHAAQEAFEQLDVQPPMVIALAKREELIYVRAKSEPIRLGRENPGLRLCQAVRDEAHRFAQHYHHTLRRKRTLGQ
jgi:excinuclease ABC subunit C